MMLRRQIAVASLLILASVCMVQASPVIGTFQSVELGGTILDGRWSESYAGGGPGQVGDAVHAASWDGILLAGQWELSGPAIEAAPTVLMDNRVGGTGTVIYFTTYDGGALVLKNAGPWGILGDADYLVNLTVYEHTTTNTYYAGALSTSTTIVNTAGTFADFAGYQVTFAVAVAVPTGEGSVLPVGYPAFVPDTVTTGAWGIAQKVRMEVIPEPATMGLLSIGLGIMAAARRRGRALR